MGTGGAESWRLWTGEGLDAIKKGGGASFQWGALSLLDVTEVAALIRGRQRLRIKVDPLTVTKQPITEWK